MQQALGQDFKKGPLKKQKTTASLGAGLKKKIYLQRGCVVWCYGFLL